MLFSSVEILSVTYITHNKYLFNGVPYLKTYKLTANNLHDRSENNEYCISYYINPHTLCNHEHSCHWNINYSNTQYPLTHYLGENLLCRSTQKAPHRATDDGHQISPVFGKIVIFDYQKWQWSQQITHYTRLTLIFSILGPTNLDIYSSQAMLSFW
jgi:hypothetical protein